MRQPSDISHPHSYCLGKGQQILWNERVTNAIAYLTAMEQRKVGAKPVPCYHQLPPLRFGNRWYHHLVANQTPQTAARHLLPCTSTASPAAITFSALAALHGHNTVCGEALSTPSSQTSYPWRFGTNKR